MEESVMVVNRLYLPGRIEGNGVSFLVDTGSGVSILAARTWRKWGHAEDELTRYWGRLCSVEGRALECLGRARLTVTLGTRVIKWSFIVAEIGDGPTSFSTRSTRATKQQLSNELDATQRHAGRRKGNWLMTCWPSGSSKRATVRGAVRPSW